MQRDYWSNKPLTVLAQSKSKGPTTNKKTNQFLIFFVWSKCGKSSDPPAGEKRSLQVLISKFKVQSRTARQVSNLSIMTVFCFFLPVMSCLVKYWLIRPQLSCERLSVRPRVFRCVRERERERYERQWDSEQLSEYDCVLWLDPPSLQHTRTHSHTHTPFPIQVSSCDGKTLTPFLYLYLQTKSSPHTSMCQGPTPTPLPCAFHLNRSSPVWAWEKGGAAPPSMASSQALGSGSECRTLPVGYEKQLCDSCVDTTARSY